MRNLALTLQDPLCLTLAADARLSPVNYVNDIIWRLSPGGGAPPALALESSLGLRALGLRLFPRLIRQQSDLVDPLEFAVAPLVQRQLPGYLRLSAEPFSGIQMTLEYWIASSSTAAGRITLRNDSLLPEALCLQLCAQLTPLGEGKAFSAARLDASLVLAGKSSGLEPVLFITGEPQALSGPHPNLSNEVQLEPGDERRFHWALAALPETSDSFHLARLTSSRPLDAEIAHAGLLDDSQRVQIHTPNPGWNAALHLGQTAALRLLMPAGKALPHPSFVLAREPEHGYSPRGDGSDYPLPWKGASALQAWTMAGSLLPGAPGLARGLVENFLATAAADGSIEFSPGPGGQRSQLLAQPVLASLAWRIHTAAPDAPWLRRVYPPLLAFVRCWFSAGHDRDGDGLPEWSHPLQTGLEDAPMYDRWNIQAQGADVGSLECPGLGAMLYRECRSLQEMTRLLKKNEDAAWLEERAVAVKQAVEETWDQRAHTYRYRDAASNRSLPGGVVAKMEGNGRLRTRRKFNPGRRLQVRIETNQEATRALLLRLRGQNLDGPVEETLTARDVQWMHGLGRVTSRNAFTWLETVEVDGLGAGERLQLCTVDTTLEDISLLLPLWAGIPSPERARELIERTLLPRYWQPHGITTCPAGLTLPDAEPDRPELGCAILPWNELIGEGLVRYGYRELAAELFTRLMHGVVNTLTVERAFRAPLCPLEQPPSGERNALGALPPFTLFHQILGLQRISNKEVILQNNCPFPGPITVQYQGMEITFQSKSSVVRFPAGESITITRPGLRRIHC